MSKTTCDSCGQTKAHGRPRKNPLATNDHILSAVWWGRQPMSDTAIAKALNISHDTLMSIIASAGPGLELPPPWKQPNKGYRSPIGDTRDQVLHDVLASDIDIPSTAKRWEIPETTLRRWVAQEESQAKAQVLRALADGCSVAKVCRWWGVSKTLVERWLREERRAA